MESNIQTWLDEINESEGSEYTLMDCNPILMERYANYKTRQFQVGILTFRMKVKELIEYSERDYELTMNELDNFLKFYDEHFNIETYRHG